MADEDVQQLEQRLQIDDQLMGHFKDNPQEVLEQHGISLTDEQRAKLAELRLAELSHDEVRRRIGKDGLRAML